MKLFLACLVGFLWLFPVPGFTTPSSTSTPDGMALISEGVFVMGSHKSLLELDPGDLFNTDRHALGPENPAHQVRLDSFFIDKHEVTNADFMKYTKSTQARKPRFLDDPDFNNPRQPVVGISWKEAQAYCKWKGGRLPTEAEWEKASRGKRSVIYPWGNEPPDSTKLNYDEKNRKTTPVGSYEAGKSDYGVYDLSGNAAEWVYDWHLAEFYLFSSKANPLGPEKGQYKVIRGGNWRNNASDVDLTYRNATVPSVRSSTVGFRCAQSTGATPPGAYPTLE